MSQNMTEYIADRQYIYIEPKILTNVKVRQIPRWFLLCSAILYSILWLCFLLIVRLVCEDLSSNISTWYEIIHTLKTFFNQSIYHAIFLLLLNLDYDVLSGCLFARTFYVLLLGLLVNCEDGLHIGFHIYDLFNHIVCFTGLIT